MTEVNVRFRWMGDGAPAAIVNAIDDGIGDGAEALTRAARQQFGRGQEGGKQRRGSPAGSPPFVQTGTLRRSITNRRRAALWWSVGTNIFYGRIHEYGGTYYMPDGTPMHFPQRPWLRPAIRQLVASGSLMRTIRKGAARTLSRQIALSARTAAGRSV